MKVKIKNRRSKLWSLWRILFPEADLSRMWLTINKTIWCPGYITEDLLIHEKTHVAQQKNLMYSLWWWMKYCLSASYRAKMEIPAYKNQYLFLKSKTRDRNQISRLRVEIAKIISGPMYKSMISYEDVYKYLEN